MDLHQRPNGITIRYPGRYQLAEARAAATDATRGRRSRTTADEAVAQSAESGMLLQALQEQELERMETIELIADGPSDDGRRTRSARGADDDPPRIIVDVPVGEGEQAVLLLEEDGYYSWTFPSVVATMERTRGGQVETLPGMVRFDIQLGAEPETAGTRSVGGWIRRQLANRVTAYVLKFTARLVAGRAMTLLERNVSRGIVVISDRRHEAEAPSPFLDPTRWRTVQDLARIKLPDNATPRVLLLVHGTFSSTLGSYGALGITDWGRAFLEDAGRNYDLILGFDHPTLSDDPLQNAVELERLLATAPWKNPPVFDAVGFSRGGLVLRSLIEMVGPNAATPPRFEKAILVGATNGGTQLAEPDNWKSLIDLYTNLIMGASRLLGMVAPSPAPVAAVMTGLVEGIGSFAKYLAIEAVSRGGIPGLAAMEPDGEFVTKLNQTQPGQPTPEEIAYFAITSDFQSTLSGQTANRLPARLLQAVADRMVDRLMGSSNDLVVDTASMTAIDLATPGFVREVCEFGSNPRVYHTVYFVQPEVCDALRTWLGIPGEPTVTRGRSRYATPPSWGTLRPEYRLLAEPAVSPPVPREMVVRPVLDVEVVWGNIQDVEGDVYAVGHYQGVLPQRAELALDHVVSGMTDQAASGTGDGDRLVLTKLTRRGLLIGELGDIDTFPVPAKPGRLVAVCGMGHPGWFGEAELRQLQRSLAWWLNVLPEPRTLCTVLIGSGEGTLTAEIALRGLLAGFADALGSGTPHRIRKLRIVELMRHKAEEILEILKNVAAESDLDLTVNPDIVEEGGRGQFSDTHRLALMITAAARACQEEGEEESKALDQLIGLLPPGFDHSAAMRKALNKLVESDGTDLSRFARRISLRVEAQDNRNDGSFATRISFVRDNQVIRAAAITQTATVPERVVDVDLNLIAEAVRRMTDPRIEDLPSHAETLLRLLVPQEFRNLLRTGDALVFEVDRHTAAVHWEMLAASIDEGDRRSVGLSRPIARQLRTE
jgi:hypothetical protein